MDEELRQKLIEADAYFRARGGLGAGVIASGYSYRNEPTPRPPVVQAEPEPEPQPRTPEEAVALVDACYADSRHDAKATALYAFARRKAQNEPGLPQFTKPKRPSKTFVEATEAEIEALQGKAKARGTSPAGRFEALTKVRELEESLKPKFEATWTERLLPAAK